MDVFPARKLALVVAVLAAVAFGCTTRNPLVFTPRELPAAQTGVSYRATITVTEAATPVGDASIQEGALPPGVSIALAEGQANTIVISGTPTTAGTFAFTVYVWCYGTNVSGQTASQAYQLVVK